jgi:hypothetical protein
VKDVERVFALQLIPGIHGVCDLVRIREEESRRGRPLDVEMAIVGPSEPADHP